MRTPRRDDETTVLPDTGVSSPFGGPASQRRTATFGGGQMYGAHETAGQPGYPGAADSSALGGAAGSGGVSEPQVAVETVVVRVRRHGRHLTWPIVVLIAVAGAGGYFIGALPETWMNIAAAAGAAFLIIFAGIGPILTWLSKRVVVTTRRVIVHYGFFVRHRSEVSLARVREVKSRQNPIQRLWGSGDIDLFVGSEATRIPDAPGLNDLHRAIQELAERSYDEQMRGGGFAF